MVLSLLMPEVAPLILVRTVGTKTPRKKISKKLPHLNASRTFTLRQKKTNLALGHFHGSVFVSIHAKTFLDSMLEIYVVSLHHCNSILRLPFRFSVP